MDVMWGDTETTADSTQRRQSRVLGELARAALLDSSRASLFELAVRALSNGLDAPCCGAIELDREERRLRVRAELGLGASLRELSLDLSGQPDYTIRVNEPVLSEDAATERRFRPSRTAIANALVTQLSAPVPGAGGPRGVVIAGFRTRHPVEPGDLEFVVAVAEILGAALMRLDRERTVTRTRQVFEVMQDALLVMRSDGKVLDANARALELYGYTREELLERSILDLRSTASLPNVLWQMRQAGASGLLFETEHRRKNGSTFRCEVSSRGAELDGEHVLVSVVRERQ
jgi:PAS domain S-box-containing protein